MRIKFLLFIIAIFLILPIRAAVASGDSDYEASEDATHVPAMIMIDEDDDIADAIEYFKGEGFDILYNRGNILLAYVPMAYFTGRSSQSMHIKSRRIKHYEIAKPRANSPAMNKARQFNDAYLISEGFNLPHAYDGSGVVIGVCDIGIDTHHPNFLTSDGSECRIRRVVHYRENQGERTVYDTPEAIYEWRSDTPDDWHASHVTGIAAGAYKGKEFYSLAPNADIVFTGSQLSDVGLLAGVEDIIAYAKEVNKPAVINLSMGNPVGPHDGTSLFTQYLDRCTEDAVICISAGNDGNTKRSFSYDFTDSKREFTLAPNDWNGRDSTGYVEIWSRDDTPFGFRFYWKNDTRIEDRLDPYETLYFTDENAAPWRISTVPGDPDYDETFAQYFFDGYVTASGGISSLNGRYRVELEFSHHTRYLHTGTTWAEFWSAIRIIGSPGSHVDVYCGGGSFLRGDKDSPSIDNAMNISDLATGYKTIVVGMMNTTDTSSATLTGQGTAPGDVNIHSSYGTLLDGRVLPHTVAPGASILSSASSVFAKAHPDDETYPEYVDYDGERFYWASNMGTSMSCPFVVSVIANWLQAYPALSAAQAKDIILKTNQTEGYPYPNDPRHGQGWLNPYAGLQEVVKLASLHVSDIESPAVTLSYSNRILTVSNVSPSPATVDIYSSDGTLRDRINAGAGLSTVPLSHLSSGIYIVVCKGSTLKVAI